MVNDDLLSPPQPERMVDVCHQECAGESEGEEQEMFSQLCSAQSQTERCLCCVVHSTSHSGTAHVLYMYNELLILD